MGIRIKKIMGYGLVDIETDKGNITDSRFNDTTSLFHPNFSIEELTEHYKNVNENDVFSELKIGAHRNISDVSPYDLFFYDDEYGLDNVFCIISPYDIHTWYRFDNIIDYYEYDDICPNHDLSPHLFVLDRPIFPYDGYINRETGERGDHKISQAIYHIRHCDRQLQRLDLPDEEVDNFQIAKNAFLRVLDCEFHWTEKWNVMIPQSVIELCRFSNLFKDEKTIWSLVPMIYTVWS